MGVSLVMWRMSPEAVAQALESGELAAEPEPLEVFEKVDKGWDILTHILASGVRDGDPPLAALAIEGGHVLENELPDYVPRRRVAR